MRIERITPDEAINLYHCMKKIDQESQYMLYLPDERTFESSKLYQDLEENYYIGVKQNDNTIVGYLSVHISKIKKIKHIGYIHTGLMEDFHQQGFATKMFNESIQWAMSRGLRRLELTVITYNSPAINFYEKIGFKIEGIKRESVYMDGLYHDELYMAKLLEGQMSELIESI